MLESHTFLTVALAMAFGVLAQAVAARLRIPSILPLLLTGLALGPEGGGLIDPAAFASGRRDLVSLAITVILFEGALGLDLDRLRAQRRPILLLLTVGSVCSLVVGAVAARLCLGFPWPVASLYGALMIVTGPTVVTPLVTRLPLARRLRELLISEGVLIDPLGAIVALVAAEYVVGQNALMDAGSLVLVRLGMGAALGVAAGLIVGGPLRRRTVPERLVNAFVLVSALVVAASASALSAEAGLMAAVAQGITLANIGVPEIGRLREFKETLTTVLLGLLFVVLSADVRLTTIASLGFGGLAVVAALMWIARPLGVVIATAGSPFTFGERAVAAWLCPRGIVAASVAGFFRILLDEAGQPGGVELEGLVFLTVAVTVAWQGATAGTVAQVFGANLPEASGAVIVGADALGRLLATTLQRGGRQVALIDRSGWLCVRAREAGLAVYEADALSLEALEDAGVRYAGTVVAVTRNHELNALVAQRVQQNFRVERVLALTPFVPTHDGHQEPDHLFPGDFPGVDAVNDRLRSGTLVAHDELIRSEQEGRSLAEFDHAEGAFVLAVLRQGGVMVATSTLRLQAGDVLVTVGRSGGARPGPVSEAEVSRRSALRGLGMPRAAGGSRASPDSHRGRGRSMGALLDEHPSDERRTGRCRTANRRRPHETCAVDLEAGVGAHDDGARAAELIRLTVRTRCRATGCGGESEPGLQRSLHLQLNRSGFPGGS